ncbi:MAG: Hsp20 family protein [Candidatus Bathyarchaeia archaeon]
MRWRRSDRRPKWFKAVKRLDEAEGRKRPKTFVFRDLKVKGHPYGYKRLEIDVSKCREPKPLLDVLNLEDGIVVVAELKGFKGENIKVKVDGRQLILSAKNQNRKYYKRLNLPAVVIPEYMHTTYKNGVLEIRLKKAVEENAMSKLAG